MRENLSSANAGIRRFRRFRVEDIRIRANTLLFADSRLLNISLRGACLKTEQSFSASTRQMVRLASERHPLVLPCSIVWEEISDDIRESGGRSFSGYKTGISFTSLPPDKVVSLKDFIRRSGTPYEQEVSDSYKPSSLRFHVNANKKAVMYYTRTFPVRKIGLGGMLVEMSGYMQRGRIFPMELVLPDSHEPIRIRGRIASAVIPSEGRPGRVDTGIEFLDMALADRFRLSTFLLFSRLPTEK